LRLLDNIEYACAANIANQFNSSSDSNTGNCTVFATDFMRELSMRMIFEHKMLVIIAVFQVLAMQSVMR